MACLRAKGRATKEFFGFPGPSFLPVACLRAKGCATKEFFGFPGLLGDAGGKALLVEYKRKILRMYDSLNE